MLNAVMVGERLYLRPLEARDAEALARGRHEETETFFEGGRVPFSPIAFAQWIEELHAQQPPDEIQLAICLNDDDQLIGMIGVERPRLGQSHRRDRDLSLVGCTA